MSGKTRMKRISLINILKGLFLVHLGAITTIMIACVNTPRFTDKELRPHVKSFELITGKKVEGYTIRFTSLKPPAVGNCNPFISEITIDPKYWGTLAKAEKVSLMYHELGHCVCWSWHYNSKFADGCPKSMMHHNMFGSKCLTKHWKYYIMDIKKRCE